MRITDVHYGILQERKKYYKRSSDWYCKPIVEEHYNSFFYRFLDYLKK